MAIEVLMPRQGNTVESCILVSWKKHEGDTVAEGETLCEVETDKATFEVPAPQAGRVLRLLAKEGDDVPVLTTIAILGAPGEAVAEAPRGKAASEATASASPKEAQAPAPSFAAVAAARTETGRRAISPRARRLAQINGVAVSGLQGSGPGGRIIERDVRAAMAGVTDLSARAGAPTPAQASPQSAASFTEMPVRGVRKLTADRMKASLAGTAQLSLDMSANAARILAYRAEVKASAPERGLSGISINDMVLFAVSRVLRCFPEVNAHFLGDKIRQWSHVNLGFAVDTPRGLLVPVIRNADGLTLKGLSARATRLAAACRDGKVNPDELSGATFTVTNLGSLGVEHFTPVLNPPEVGILGVCAIQPKPVQSGTEVSFAPHIMFSLTIDHQAVDGAPAARFLAALCGAVSQFDLLLAE
jgi:pyruvate dehydrogenase E2 component (dihydrolipoamide acetyltransferase)